MRIARLFAAAILLTSLAACGDKAANGSPEALDSSSPSSASSESPADDGGVGALGAAGATASPTAAKTSAAAASAGKAPTQTFAVASAQFTFTRAGRTLRTVVWYPKSSGRFPLVLWSHGLHGSPEGYAGVTQKIAAAGFVVAAPAYPFTNDKADPFNQNDMANQPADASAVITEVLKQDTQSGSVLAGRIDTAHVGAAGHSAGGYTTAGLLSGSTRDARLKGAVIVSGGSMGGKFTGAATPVLFIHGDADTTVPYSSGKSLYDSCTWPKGFLTLLGGDHGASLWGSTPAATAVSKTMLDLFRYSLYGDAAARSRLRSDATAPNAAKYDGTL
ncbi:alpha/beta hydrolase family protein [Dactylosporangium salmoneum]|uniref:PET hydrolase/cutinase-like domain-containing protein n=1 Tax=Dactylosporangium salmoneum TaxID=53361 RepID=A0ABP5UDQ0_9ACTN